MDANKPCFHTNTWTGISVRNHLAAQFAAAWVVALGRRLNVDSFREGDIVSAANHLGFLQADEFLGLLAK